MWKLAYILLLVGLCAVADNAYEEHRASRGDAGYVLVDDDLVNRRSPEGFRNAMTVRWVSAALIVLVGASLFVVARRQDRLDPLSPDFKWQDNQADP